jgi:hypothetical protein
MGNQQNIQRDINLIKDEDIKSKIKNGVDYNSKKLKIKK